MSKNKDVALNTNIPVTFQKVSQFDNRFVQVKIFLMHLGLNYNGSVFTKESVERALPSLKNTPILGYVDENAIGQQDYAGHEMELVVEDGDYKFKYLGSAFGVIPETNNARWETKRGDDGLEREYLVVDGLMWSKFDDAMGILDRDQIKGQSMELHEDYDGEFDEEGNFVFNKFSFYGACILGDGVQPAMQRATVERVFSADMLKQEVNNMMEEFKLTYGNFENNQAKEVDKMTFTELLEKYGVTAEQLIEKGINAEEFSTEELEVKIQEEFKEAEEDTPEDNNKEGKNGDGQEPEMNHEADQSGSENGDEGSQEDPDNEFQDDEGKDAQGENKAPEGDFSTPETSEDESRVFRKFALAHDDIRNQLWDKVDNFVEENELGERWDFWIQKVYEDYFIMNNEYSGQLYKVNYSKENDSISLGEYVEVFAQYLTSEEKGALELMRSNFATIEVELNQLKEFKKDIVKDSHKAQADELIAGFGLDNKDKEVQAIKENVHNFSIEQIEDKMYALVGRKNFSVELPKPNKIAIQQEGNTQAGKSYSHLFAKHGIE